MLLNLCGTVFETTPPIFKQVNGDCIWSPQHCNDAWLCEFAKEEKKRYTNLR